ncbi:hypothetical protein RM704_11420 [Streptomyces sp. DSM 3412]|uniref:Uncharacterized protein n=1 Tax=Streptomyces gottesmaniae TaxID=3075518 RepID=A0ABU2YUS8_9ACTN|nr:hypothetical protein [Streptomyces sp. DSM 3412]MDT0568072.1 hypothetical protein [Streptomyces sp. DSM 3412]
MRALGVEAVAQGFDRRYAEPSPQQPGFGLLTGESRTREPAPNRPARDSWAPASISGRGGSAP